MSSNTLVRQPTKRIRDKLTKDFLQKTYIEEKQSIKSIAKTAGVERATVTNLLRFYGHQIRGPGEQGSIDSIVYSIDEGFFERIDTYEKAYIVGFILGDGHISDRRKSKQVTVTLAASDKKILEEMASIISPSLCITTALSYCKTRNEQPKATLRICRTKMANDLITLGIPAGNKTNLEKFIIMGTKELTWSFILGMSDADGCVRVYQRNNYWKASWGVKAGEEFIAGLKDFLEIEGIKVPPKAAYKVINENIWEFRVSSIPQIKSIREKLYANCSIYMERKKKIFDKLEDIVRTSKKFEEVGRNVQPVEIAPQ